MNWTEADIKNSKVAHLNPQLSASAKNAQVETPLQRMQALGRMKAGKMKVSLRIKPLSVNEAWQGKRFKTKKYLAYEKELMLKLPKLQMPQPPYKVFYEFGFSNSLSDWDNPCKPLQDIMQKKYGFNDRDILEANVKKLMVKKGDEYFTVYFESIYP